MDDIAITRDDINGIQSWSHFYNPNSAQRKIEVSFHFIRAKPMQNVIKTTNTNSANQLADLFTRPLGGSRVSHICNKYEIYDLYAPPRGVCYRVGVKKSTIVLV